MAERTVYPVLLPILGGVAGDEFLQTYFAIECTNLMKIILQKKKIWHIKV